MPETLAQLATQAAGRGYRWRELGRIRSEALRQFPEQAGPWLEWYDRAQGALLPRLQTEQEPTRRSMLRLSVGDIKGILRPPGAGGLI
jgi:hypothetical protein